MDVGVRYDHQRENKAGFTGLSVATRGELLEWPMLGYEPDFRGYGISHLHVESDFNWGSVTVGDVYGQFGSGLILRLYEDRFLGVDNALRGGKIALTPYKASSLRLLAASNDDIGTAIRTMLGAGTTARTRSWAPTWSWT